MEGTSGGLWSQLKAGLTLTLAQVAQGFILFGLENLQGLQVLSGQPAPLLGCPQGEKVFLSIQSESLLF